MLKLHSMNKICSIFLMGSVLLIAFVTLALAGVKNADDSPERWKNYDELKGNFSLSGSGDFTMEKDGFVFAKCTASLSAKGAFTLKREMILGDRVRFSGQMDKGIADSNADLSLLQDYGNLGNKGGGAIAPAGSSVVLEVNYKEGTYTIELSGQTVKGSGSGQLEMYAVTRLDASGVEIKKVNENLGESDTHFSATLPFEVLMNNGLPLPKTGKAISGSSTMIAGINTCAGISINGQWWIETEPPVALEVQNLTRPGSHCACDKDGQVHITAINVYSSATEGTFEKFIVEPTGKMPEVVKNEGGKTPTLIIKGKGKEHSKITITAVYKKEVKTYKSDPYELSFCKIDKPRFMLSPNAVKKGDDTYFIFDSSTPSGLDFTVFTETWMDGQELAKEDVDIKMDRNSENLFKIERPESEKPKMKFKAENLPEKNDTFGERKITATVKKGNCDCEEEVRTALFFPRDSKNNPEGKEPNWSYYWKQTSAGVASDGSKIDYKVVPAIPPFNKKLCLYFSCFMDCGGIPPDPRGIAEYDNFEDVIYIPEALPSMLCAQRAPNAECESGIDCYANTIRHENQHRINTISWWGPGMENYSCVNDLDGDSVPNVIEDKYKDCDPLDATSCDGRPLWLGDLGDMEFGTYQAGWSWKTGWSDKEDWAYPGKQLQ